ncbi:hypothetical protein DB30_06919 [Enhygromyxa salina]|uniref:Uncharacterized protein n=1 Tax=Enhygromyxa salina TaxID=215803 RepID=A0A0C2D2G4_9BACT|nr:hypothetical protein DB30_06919 [Enhygromyxa salina]
MAKQVGVAHARESSVFGPPHTLGDSPTAAASRLVIFRPPHALAAFADCSRWRVWSLRSSEPFVRGRMCGPLEGGSGCYRGAAWWAAGALVCS